ILFMVKVTWLYSKLQSCQLLLRLSLFCSCIGGFSFYDASFFFRGLLFILTICITCYCYCGSNNDKETPYEVEYIGYITVYDTANPVSDTRNTYQSTCYRNN